MDRPLGPRQPDKRLTAYETIFGRPGVSHQASPHPQNYNTPPPNFPQPQYPYPSNQSHYNSPTTLDRLSYSPQSSDSRQAFYVSSPPPPQNPSWSYPNYPYLQPQYSSSPQPSLSPIPPNNPLPISVYPPQSDDPSESTYNSPTRHGLTLTPPNPYQTQPYHNNTVVHQQPSWGTLPQPVSQQQQLPYEYEPDYRYQNGSASPSYTNIPHLGVNIDSNNGQLGLDFDEESSPSDTEDSELPWANSQSRTSFSMLLNILVIVPLAGIQHRRSYYQTAPQPTPAHHRLSRRQSPPDNSSIHSADSGYSATPPPSSKPYTLQLDTALMNQPSRAGSLSVNLDTSVRRSSDSFRTVPGPSRRDRSSLQPQDRSRSMSATTSAHVRSSFADIPSPASTSSRIRSAGAPQVQGNRRASSYPRSSPIVYPALLSRVADALRARIVLTDIVKDGLTYKNAFDGRQAVDKIAYIIKTTDRNLALLLGRALDAQKYFHAVTYDHRLRDSASDVYQFRTRVGSPFHSGELSPPPVTSPSSQGTITPTPDTRPELAATRDTGSPSNEASTESDQGKQNDRTIVPDGASTDAAEDVQLPTGVFTLLTDCYSPTCSRDRLCYSITCPRRLEQQSRLNMKPLPGLGIKRQLSRESLGDLDHSEPGLLWIHTVSKEIVDSVSDQEKRRQEAINEVIYTERDFVRALEYLRDVRSVFFLDLSLL
jgi:RHO1 GDP-GTP exchange protein 1/2